MLKNIRLNMMLGSGRMTLNQKRTIKKNYKTIVNKKSRKHIKSSVNRAS